jgi:polar amino acid transport system substrate-binding protein
MRHLQPIRTSAVVITMALLMMPVTTVAQTLERIKSSGTLNIGFVPDQAPFSSAAAEGASGYSIELCQKVAEATKAKLRLRELQVNFLSTTIQAGLEKASSGQIDLLCGAVTNTLKRREIVSFSMPIFNGGIGALMRLDAPPALVRVLNGEEAYSGPIWRATIRQGLADHTYAVDAGTTTEAWVREKVAGLRVIATIVTVDDHEKGIEMVLNGEADAYFADREVLREYVNRSERADELTIADRQFTYEPLALALARNNDDFRLVVDTTLSNIYHSDTFIDLYTRYFGKPSEFTLKLFKIYARD